MKITTNLIFHYPKDTVHNPSLKIIEGSVQIAVRTNKFGSDYIARIGIRKTFNM